MIIERKDLIISYEMTAFVDLVPYLRDDPSLVENWLGITAHLMNFAETADRVAELDPDGDGAIIHENDAQLILEEETIKTLASQDDMTFDQWCGEHFVTRLWRLDTTEDPVCTEPNVDEYDEASGTWKSLEDPALMTLEEALAIGDYDTVLRDMYKPSVPIVSSVVLAKLST